MNELKRGDKVVAIHPHEARRILKTRKAYAKPENHMVVVKVGKRGYIEAITVTGDVRVALDVGGTVTSAAWCWQVAREQ